MRTYFSFLVCLLLWAASAHASIGLRLDVKSSFSNFALRFEKKFRDLVSQDERFLMSVEGYDLAGQSTFLNLEMTYPVRPFPKETGMYVKINGLGPSARYVYYHHPSYRDGDLSLEQSRQFSDHVIRDLLETLWSHAQGKMLLTLGYYENRRSIDLGAPLDIELLGPKVRGWQDLVQEQDDDRVSLIEEKWTREIDAGQAMPTQRKAALDRRRQLKTLSEEWNKEKRAQAYRNLAKLYDEHELEDDAQRYAKKALNEDQSVASKVLLNDLQGEERLPAERFRWLNKNRGLSLSWSSALEYDTNIIQEEVDNFTQSQTKDWGLLFLFHLKKDWLLREKGFKTSSFFDVSNDSYIRHEELDLVTMQGGQSLAFAYGQDVDLETKLSVGYHYHVRRGQSVMAGLQLMLEQQWAWSETDLMVLNAQWYEKQYSNHFYSDIERSGDLMNFGLFYQKLLPDDRSLSVYLGQVKDDVGDKTLSYEAQVLDAAFEMLDPWFSLVSLRVNADYEKREYQAREFGRAKVREDAKFEYGLKASYRPFPAHLMSLGFLRTDNQSTRRVSRYIRHRTTLSYEVNF